MGDGRWDSGQWEQHAQSVSAKTVSQIFTQSYGINSDLDPKNIKVRESVDSSSNPNSTPVMIFVDDTGSMGHLAENIIKRGLGIIMKEIYERKPISDPHILCGAVGDAYSDQAPLQASQFEAEVDPLTKQIEKVWIEANGGGNGGESYLAAWWFAAHKTKCDAIQKRNRKGYLFTIGDEAVHNELTKSQIKDIFGEDVESNVNAKDLFDVVSQNWEVFHLIVPTESTKAQKAKEKWQKILGERAIEVIDHEKLAEVIVSTIQVIEGEDIHQVTQSWDGSTAVVVQRAVQGLSKRQGQSGETELVRL